MWGTIATAAVAATAKLATASFSGYLLQQTPDFTRIQTIKEIRPVALGTQIDGWMDGWMWVYDPLESTL